MTQTDKILFAVENLNLTYKSKAVKNTVVFKNAACDINRHHMHMIEGPNGSGKTSLLGILAGLVEHDQHCIKLPTNEQPLLAKSLCKRYRLLHLPQFPLDATRHSLTMAENVWVRKVELDGRNYDWFWHWLRPVDRKDVIKRIRDAIQSLGIKNDLQSRVDSDMDEFSGGELQLLNLVGAVIAEPDVVLMDEPTGKLDDSNRKLFWQALHSLLKLHPLTIICATHDRSYLETFKDSENLVCYNINNCQIQIDNIAEVKVTSSGQRYEPNISY